MFFDAAAVLRLTGTGEFLDPAAAAAAVAEAATAFGVTGEFCGPPGVAGGDEGCWG